MADAGGEGARSDGATTSAAPADGGWLRGFAWVPSLYFVQGLPYAVVNNVAPVVYKNLGVGNAEMTFWVSWMSSVWAFKALWSPFVDTVSTKRTWVLAMQALMGPTLAVSALALGTPSYFEVTIALFFVLAFLSATHDIAADGLYMLGLPQGLQSAFVGVRSTFWRLALMSGEGGLVYLSGRFAHTMAPAAAWTYTLGIAGAVFVAATLLHVVALPRPADDRPASADVVRGSADAFASFFRKPGIVAGIAFLVFYRFAENQLVKLIVPFLLDPRESGGLGLTNEELGFAKGTVGVLALIVGGILGGLAVSRWGLRRCLWPMVAIMHLPDLVFVYLSAVQPTSYPLVVALIGVEQFGYGFGFQAYMMFMILLAQGPNKTAHYAIGTGIMALSVTLTGMFTGALQERIGYQAFFLWVLVSIVPGLLVAWWVDIPRGFGASKPQEG